MNKFKVNKFDLDSDCLHCPLSDQHLVNIETNCKSLDGVDVLIIAESPSINEIKHDQPLHPKGDSGRGFRIAFETSKLNTLNYCISNACLCSNLINNKTAKLPKEAIEYCAINLDSLISNCNPKCIIALGKTIQFRLKIPGNRITSLRGKFYTYSGYNVLLTVHPRYFQMQGGIHSEEGKNFLNDLKIVYDFITGECK